MCLECALKKPSSCHVLPKPSTDPHPGLLPFRLPPHTPRQHPHSKPQGPETRT
ncbi:hypothetical protein K505DRAFT_322977 [Melanomma pulvis-pyrius CBS 109.77]|uniref:Uncharacterized protein n=1 Tax=Melanomma pulvis-pyrius CBS 109.77 TaxID=1314802 RepID=A0A6A6XKA6_9PLEO|nr:hypothetical protein K505DRAFT_322977 [Melanomma pulvis-pyrius CBS 109.77]